MGIAVELSDADRLTLSRAEVRAYQAANAEHVAERNRLAEENDRLRESVAWWQRVAEAKQVERDTIRAALEMIAQVRHVSGSAQAARRSDLRVADAALLGADMRDLATVEAVVAGTWNPTA